MRRRRERAPHLSLLTEQRRTYLSLVAALSWAYLSRCSFVFFIICGSRAHSICFSSGELRFADKNFKAFDFRISLGSNL